MSANTMAPAADKRVGFMWFRVLLSISSSGDAQRFRIRLITILSIRFSAACSALVARAP